MARRPRTITERLKRAIEEFGESYAELERATGVKRASVMRFVRGDQSLRLDMADRLASHFGIECIAPQSVPVPRRFQATDLTNRGDCRLVRLVHLMMAFDALRTGYRWMRAAHADARPIARSDLLLSLIVCAGWTWETRTLLMKGKDKGELPLSLLSDEPHRRFFVEITARQPSIKLRRIKKIRDRSFGHFDDRLARSFLDRPDDEIPPFLETTGDGKLLETRYPWAAAAISGDLYPTPFTVSTAKQYIEEVSDTIQETFHLVGALISALAKEIGLSFTPVDESK